MAIDLITGHQGQMHISAAQVANLNNSLMNGAGDHKVLRLIDGTVSFTGLIVSVANGYWRVNGYDMEIYEEEVVNIDPSSTGTSRIDKVFVEILQDIPSGIQRSELVVVKGEESAGTPVAPDAPTDPVLNTDLLLQCEEVCVVTVTEGAMTISDSTEEYTTVTPAELAIVEGKADQAILDAAAAQGTANTASTNAGYALQMIKKSSDAYSNTKAYKVGDCVIQNNTVYKCHTPCSAASWAVNSSCFTATSLTESVTELNSSLPKNYGTAVNVTSYTSSSSPYVFGSDGVLYLRGSTNGAIQAILLDSSNTQIIDLIATASSVNPYVETVTVPVFKGMKVYINSSNANGTVKFIPYSY